MILAAKKNILFVSHNASRTGAPIVLITFLNWLKKNHNINITVLLKNGGELENKFAQFGRVYNLRQNKRIFFNRVCNLIYRKIKKQQVAHLPSSLKRMKIDLIYINTIESLEILSELKSVFKCPVVCHVHENEFTINYYYPQSLSAVNKTLVDHYIAVSKSTYDNLTIQHSIPKGNISLCYEFIPVDEINKPKNLPSVIKKAFGITDEFIVGASGLTSWRKGADLFVQLAVVVDKLRPANNIKFVWVGHKDEFFNKCYDYENRRLNVANKIIFTGSKEHPEDYFQIFDVFSLTSREDPFPLVCLEAAALSKPIVCFDNSGGIAEFICSFDPRSVVAYGDVEAMAKAILQFYDDRSALKVAGDKAYDSVKQYDVSIIAPQILNVIGSMI